MRTIKLQRGQGGSIGLQVTEGNDSGVYVQAVSVGGSADMAGNVNKGDRIVAINGQSLLNLRYEDALKMLQSTSETVELVLSQVVSLPCPALLTDSPDDDLSEPMKNSYLQNLKFGVSSERESSSMTSTKWLQKLGDVASVQNTSSAYSSAASSAMGNHNVNSLYVPDIDDTEGIHSVSRLLTLEDLDISHVNNQQVFI
uniref:PDZ domain-containing protein n=1 Tax=Trichogramma kaykai TaxID=54128 RepID=A0ABD2WI20_9HYME